MTISVKTLCIGLVIAFLAYIAWIYNSIDSWAVAEYNYLKQTWELKEQGYKTLKYIWPLALVVGSIIGIVGIILLSFAEEKLETSDLRIKIKQLEEKLELANESVISAKANAKMDLNKELKALEQAQIKVQQREEKAIQMRDKAIGMAEEAKEIKEYANERVEKAKGNVKKSQTKAKNASAGYARIKGKEKKKSVAI